jgi:hypothetical protein
LKFFSVSEILSSKYLHLDELSSRRTPKHTRIRKQRWPELESALFEWIQRAEAVISISGDLWNGLPQYPTDEMPTFSNGWLSGFQARYQVKSQSRHGEAAEVAPEHIRNEVESIQEVLRTFAPRDRYNCDETGLFWKRIPSRSFSTRAVPARRRDKTRITAHFCCNSDGSDKLPIGI